MKMINHYFIYILKETLERESKCLLTTDIFCAEKVHVVQQGNIFDPFFAIPYTVLVNDDDAISRPKKNRFLSQMK